MTQPDLLPFAARAPAPRPAPSHRFDPKEYKVIALRECPTGTPYLEDPEKAAAYWREHIPACPYFNPAVEHLVVLLLNTRRRVLGHALVAAGTLDMILLDPRDVFRPPLVASAAAIILTHNHPSGDPTPSAADITVTRQLIKAGEILKVAVLDHIVMGHPQQPDCAPWCSLRSLGYFN